MKKYELDPDTQDLVEVALNCLVSLADAQVQEESRIGLIAIAEQLADTFGIDRMEVEVHEGDDGEEIIYRPPSDLFGSKEDDDDELDSDEPRGC